ncbi:MAG: zf-HC2 domain-containing protein [Phycisphaerae bacterium]|nr:zf-HC2 domain-containing protein [Phycisphaerae bacterium]
MNCQGFQKYVGAFADGELDVPLNLEALEHLNVCPNCAGKVARVHGLRAALRDAYADTVAPAALHGRLRGALGLDVPRTNHSAAGGQPSARPGGLRRRWFLPMSVAAMILLAAVLVLRSGPLGGLLTATSDGSAAQFAADVRDQHALCISNNAHIESHRLADASPRLVAETLSNRLNLRVLAPDLHSSGYDLIGGRECGVRGRTAGHALYERDEGTAYLSIFSASRGPDVTPNRTAEPFGSAYYADVSEGMPTVVAWSDHGGTYAACATLPEAELVKVLAPLQGTARRWSGDAQFVAQALQIGAP